MIKITMGSFKWLLLLILLVLPTLKINCAQVAAVIDNETNSFSKPQIKVECLSDSMIISIMNAPSASSSYFNGIIYPKDLAKNSSCSTEYHEHIGKIIYKLPLKSCSTIPQENEKGEIEFMNTIVLQPHLKLVTDLTTSFYVNCKYQRKMSISTRNPENPLAYTSQTLESVNDRRNYGRALDNEVINNDVIGCHMKIFSNNKLVQTVTIGDMITITINIDKQNEYGLKVTECSVRDGIGVGEQQLIDKNGCPIDPEIMGKFVYSKNRQEASVTFPAHRFPYSSAVYYQCNVKICDYKNEKCLMESPCDNRKKRDTNIQGEVDDEGLPAAIEVYSGLYVNENLENIDYEDSVLKEKTNEDAICVSQRNFAIAIAIAGLILMLLVVIVALCIMARRNRKETASSGSSIYSGPYTNTAFSHSS